MRHVRGLVSVYGEGSVKEAGTDSQRNVVGNQKMTKRPNVVLHILLHLTFRTVVTGQKPFHGDWWLQLEVK